jgi:hypothetical protein
MCFLLLLVTVAFGLPHSWNDLQLVLLFTMKRAVMWPVSLLAAALRGMGACVCVCVRLVARLRRQPLSTAT